MSETNEPAVDEPWWMKRLGVLLFSLFIVVVLGGAIVQAILDARTQPSEPVSPMPSSTYLSTATPTPSSTAPKTDEETTSPDPEGSATTSSSPTPEFADIESMTSWMDAHTEPCEEWTMHDEGTLEGASCDQGNEVVVYSSSKLLLSMVLGNIEEYDPSLVGMQYVGDDKWLIISTDQNDLRTISEEMDLPIQTL